MLKVSVCQRQSGLKVRVSSLFDFGMQKTSSRGQICHCHSVFNDPKLFVKSHSRERLSNVVTFDTPQNGVH